MLLSSTFWLWAAVFLTAICLMSGTLEYVFSPKILKGYFMLFFSDGINLKGITDVIFFVGLPMVLATATNLHKVVTIDILDVICIVISILTAMLFSFMGVIQDKFESVKMQKDMAALDFEWYQNLQKETFNVIAIETLVSTFMLVLCFVQPIIKENDKVLVLFDNNAMISIQTIVSWFILCGFYFFIINVLMIIKRFYAFSMRK